MRNNDKTFLRFRYAAQTALTAGAAYLGVGPKKFLYQGFAWMYETAEANTDNVCSLVIDYTVDGTNYVSLQALTTNPWGHLDTRAPLVYIDNPVNAGASGIAAVTQDAASGATGGVTEVDVPAFATIRVRLTTAGTGTIPAQTVDVYGLPH